VKRRALVLATLAAAGLASGAGGATRAARAGRYLDYPDVMPGVKLEFPRDHGAHPEYRTEWWYVTGLLQRTDGAKEPALGFQVTFFRSRLDTDPANPSRFAPHQLLFAHAAVSDPPQGHLFSEQRASRAGFGLAEAAQGDLAVHLGAWSLVRDVVSGRFQIRLAAREFAFTLELTATEPPLLEGEAGYSQKSPLRGEASEYYSLPHLQVSGSVRVKGSESAVRGQAWMDREWSSNYLAEEASGWDWTGLNLEDGGALMAFRIRRRGADALWAAATLRHADGTIERFGAAAVRFTTLSSWRSPRSGVLYPVMQKLVVGPYAMQLEPLMQDQELDSSASTGTIYWEGAVRAVPDRSAAAILAPAEGYLELTGYDQPLTL
jgi:predicted secreted hydrolase